MRQHNAGGIVARVKAGLLCGLKLPVEEVFYPVTVLEKFLRICRICDIDVIDKPE